MPSKDKEKLRQKSRRFYQKNKKKILARQAKYKKLNKYKYRKYCLEYYYRNRKLKGKRRRCILCGKFFKATNGKSKLCGSAFKKGSCSYKRNLISMKMYKVRKKKALGCHTLKEWENLKKKYNHCCAKCGMQEPFNDQWYHYLTEDHIVSLKMGGTNYIENIQPLCQRCNSKKGSKG